MLFKCKEKKIIPEKKRGRLGKTVIIAFILRGNSSRICSERFLSIVVFLCLFFIVVVFCFVL